MNKDSTTPELTVKPAFGGSGAVAEIKVGDKTLTAELPPEATNPEPRAEEFDENAVPYIRADGVFSSFHIHRDGLNPATLRDNGDDHEIAVWWDAEASGYKERPDFLEYSAIHAAGVAEAAARAAAAAPATLARTNLQRERDAQRRAARAGKKR